MSKEFKTERLILKSISEEDREFIFSQFSDVAVTKYLFDQEPLTDIGGADKIINSYLHPAYEGVYRWILVSKADNIKMGTCGFHCWNKEKNMIEIGYDLKRNFEGQGYMQEALKEIISFAVNEMKISQINAHIFCENYKSIALVKRLGFINSGKDYTCSFNSKDLLHNIYSSNYKIGE